ncbi:hypothetical protein DSC45_05835 [Streptomyces sp. YIM 130001]|uniref:hypothetical protein n=1 Tax=Streptomyces sp. YIM 130001 TaxID=2259644 RepID=UPI000ED20259|nr:hypothetical protein [Streptomyces sp. YIM 130001]RII19515.1 hypothetical protein DSC45_05835 [Streptomyces sp. YIM 130001]
MTHPPNGSTAPPGAPTVPAVPPQASAPPTPPPAPVLPERRSAWNESTDRLRAAATTEPGRLRIIGAVLAVLVVVFGALASWQMSGRSAAADDVLNRSQPLSADAASIYRSLADANTAAASGFLAGGQEPADVRKRYQDDLDMAAEKLATAASNSKGSQTTTDQLTQLGKLLPEYAERIETARTYNRQGLPLGGAYLRDANDLMQKQMLPAAKKLYDAEKKQLDADYADARSYPWAAIGLGVVALGALGWAQRRNYRRTNRVFNRGLVTATAAGTVALLWLSVGHTIAWSNLNDSYDNGVRSLNVLNDARVSTLQARSNENLTLVARGAVTVPDGPNEGKDAYDVDYQKQMSQLGTGGERSGFLGSARQLADDSAGMLHVGQAADAVAEWQKRHKSARDADTQGNYDAALARVIGDDNPTGDSFDKADKALEKALAHEQSDFKDAAESGRGAMTGLPVGAAVLAVLGAAGAVLGIGRRLSEYR